MDMMESFFKMGSSLVIVLAIVVVAAAVSRRWLLPHGTAVPQYRLRIGGSVSLGGRRTVVVLEIGGRTLVVGVTPQNLVLLSQFDKDLPDPLPVLNPPKAENPISRVPWLAGLIKPRAPLAREASAWSAADAHRGVAG
jgi:flagellar biogenesis protein FliO